MSSMLTRRNALALLGSLVPAAAFGAAYPERPVKVVVALANYIDNHGGRAMIASLAQAPEKE